MEHCQRQSSIKQVDLESTGQLEGASLHELVRELHGRLTKGGDRAAAPDRATVRLLVELDRVLARTLETPENRFSAAYLQELLGTYFFWHRDLSPSVEGETFLELGAGAESPFGLSFAMTLLGARRAYCLELSPPLSEDAQARGLASFAWLLAMRPDLFPKVDLRGFRATVLENMERYDLRALAAGRLELPDDVSLLVQPAESTGLMNGSVDRVVSSSFLEHPDDPRGVVAEIARITAPGGISIHNIDTVDHGIYWGEADSEIAFLCEQPGAKSVRGCNRMRIPQYLELFAAHGFTLLRRKDYGHHDVTPEERALLVEPFSSMSDEDLRPVRSVLVLRRDG